MKEKELIKNSKCLSRNYEYLYRKYSPKIFSYFLRRVSSKEVAEDLTQETFFRAFRKIKDFRYQGYPYSSYLFKIARNLLVNYYKNPKPLSLEAIEHNPSFTPNYSRVDEYVWRVINDLSGVEKKIMFLKYNKGKKVKEISSIVDKSENAVKLILSRARKKIRNHPYLKDTF